MALWLYVVGTALAEPVADWRQADRPAALRPMLIYVEDQYGQLVKDATIAIRDRSSYILVDSIQTNELGYAEIELDTQTWYIAQLYFTDHGTREFWSYDYIKAEDWGSNPTYGVKRMRRDDPWIETVTLPEADVHVGEPISISVELDHYMEQTNFDLWCRVTAIVDDDGVAPYFYQETSDEQIISDGFVPFTFQPKIDLPGDYRVRIILERKFELNDWMVGDEGGWSWSATVAGPTANLDGLVYLDMNGDGQHQESELLGAGVLVQAYNGVADPIAEAVADDDGHVCFGALETGAYSLRLAKVPAGLGRAREVYHAQVSEGITNTVQIQLDPWRADLPWVTVR